MISKINPNKRFSFCSVFYDEVLKQIKNLGTKKTIQQNDIPTKLLKQIPISFQKSSVKTPTKRIENVSIENSKFPSDFKLEGVTHLFKKNSQKPQKTIIDQ